MSTQIEFKWKPGELKTLYVKKAENGFTVQVAAGDSHNAPTVYVFASWAHALQLMNECFCWDAAPKEEVVAEPVPRKFPASFRRFEIRGTDVWAVFAESGAEWSRNARELEERIQWLRVYEYLTPEELGKWNAVLAEVRARNARHLEAAKS